MVGGQASGFWLAEVSKTGIKTSLFYLNYMQQSIGMAMVLQHLLLRGGSPFGFFLFARLSLGIWIFSRASDYCVLCIIM